MRIVRKTRGLKGPLKWLMLPFIGLAAVLSMQVVAVISPYSGFSIFRHWPTGLVMLTGFLFVRSFDSGQLPGVHPRPHDPVDPLRAPRRWDTGRSARTVYLAAAAIVAAFIGVIALKLPDVIAEGYEAGVFILGLGTNVLLVVFVLLVALAFRKPNVMVIDPVAVTLTGKDPMVIPLANIEDVVIRPRTDRYVAVLRLIEPPRDIALELGRLSLDPRSFAAELAARRPSIGLSESAPGVFAASDTVARLTAGDPREIR